MPALLFLGQEFRRPFDNPLEALARSVHPTIDPNELLCALDGYAHIRNTRCLILIDAINEGDRPSWRRGLPTLITAIRSHPRLALAIGCRTPFEKLLFSPPEVPALQTAHHYGFPPEQQIDAIAKYFAAYSIPLPEVPLLEQEFSNPLFLKIFCEALEDATIRRKHAQIQDVASGQKGMTYVLEYFVRRKGRIISERLGCDANLAWVFLKNHVAPKLAMGHTDAIDYATAKALADAQQPAHLESGAFLKALIDEDVLAEDVMFVNLQAQEVIRFTYQKFADHLIARHLLATQLDTSDSSAIRRSLRDPQKLGAYFLDQDAALSQINIVQALLIEFPTRIKNRGELLDFLDWRDFPIRFCEAFLEGLYWRDPKSINKSTRKLIASFLQFPPLRNETLDVLLALSVKPQHPFHAGRLDRFLVSLSISDRDLGWTEFLRKSMDRRTPIRILVWTEHVAPKKPSADFARAYIKVLKWFLTSTQRGFRDRSTRALFRLGRAHPSALFSETIDSLAINDPYVSQRMLAASYGTTMALWQDRETSFRRSVLPSFARRLFNDMFAKNASRATTHILTRDYAQRIIELAILVKPNLFSASARRLLTPPFRFGGIRRWGEMNDQDQGKYREGDKPLGMDFANYTLGRLVRHRAPYEDNSGDYQKVKKQILWRIYELGYSLDRFSSVDREIARFSWYAEQREQKSGKTDRYGKKYSWIAFYELAGYRTDLGLVDRDERISDADIDPSFPERPGSKKLFHRPWIKHEGSVREWLFSEYQPEVHDHLMLSSIDNLEGPWIMLHGHVNQETTDKTIFAFFDGLFVRNADIGKFLENISSIGYPGNRAIPRPESEYYTYAGEIPWANTWRPQQYQQEIVLNGSEIHVFPTCRDYSWESYHSSENQTGGFSFPTKELGQHLKLYVRIPSVQMAQEGSTSPATVILDWGDRPYHNYESFLFIRKGLLDDYLKKEELTLAVMVWGERRANYRDAHNAHEIEGSFRIDDVLHKQGFTYTGRNFSQFM